MCCDCEGVRVVEVGEGVVAVWLFLLFLLLLALVLVVELSTFLYTHYPYCLRNLCFYVLNMFNTAFPLA